PSARRRRTWSARRPTPGPAETRATSARRRFSHKASARRTKNSFATFLAVHGLFCAAKALTERDQHPLGQRRHLAQERDEVATGNDEQPHGGLGDDRGRSGLTVEQADLAEERAGTDLSLILGRNFDARRPVHDHEEAVAGLAHSSEDFAGRHLLHP